MAFRAKTPVKSPESFHVLITQTLGRLLDNGRYKNNVGMAIDLTLTNNSNSPIGVPLEFLQQVGPRCALIDNETQETLPPCAFPPADLSLRDKFTSVAPGESIRMDEYLSASAIRGLREWMIDLTAEFAIHISVKLEGIKLPVR